MPNHTRIPRVILTPISTSYLYTRNPWVPAWWSVILPGLGHLTLGHHLRGLVLMALELLVNDRAHINLAIFYTLLGHHDQARAVMDYRWAVLYPAFYAFTIWDAYRVTVEYNRLSRLETLQKHRRFDRISLTALGIHSLDRRNPAIAAFWSAAMTGLGHLVSNRLVKALVLMGWYLAIVLRSNLSLAVYYTLLGDFHRAAQVVDYHWLLFWPSIFVFGIVDAYAEVVEQNVLADMAFRYRIRKYLRNDGSQQ